MNKGTEYLLLIQKFIHVIFLCEIGDQNDWNTIFFHVLILVYSPKTFGFSQMTQEEKNIQDQEDSKEYMHLTHFAQL